MTEKKAGDLPPLEWLRVFEAAGRTSNFTAAAQELGLTQAAVSQRIRNLEGWLGQALFERKARGVTLTIAGESYLPPVRDALKSLALSTGDLFGKPLRELRILAVPSNIQLLICPRLGAFRKAYPEVRVTLVSAWHQRDFDESGIAVQVRHGHGDWPGSQAVLLHSEAIVPMAAPGLKDWEKAPLIEVAGRRPGWNQWASETGSPLPRRPLMSFDSLANALRAAEDGLGVVLGSNVLAAKALKAGRLIRLPASQLLTKLDYWLCRPREQSLAPREDAMLVSLRAALSAEI